MIWANYIYGIQRPRPTPKDWDWIWEGSRHRLEDMYAESFMATASVPPFQDDALSAQLARVQQQISQSLDRALFGPDDFFERKT